MKNIEFLNKATAEELAERIVKDEKFRRIFDRDFWDSFFGCDVKYEDCQYYEDGMCSLSGEECPHSINRDDVLKNEILKWLNSDM